MPASPLACPLTWRLASACCRVAAHRCSQRLLAALARAPLYACRWPAAARADCDGPAQAVPGTAATTAAAAAAAIAASTATAFVTLRGRWPPPPTTHPRLPAFLAPHPPPFLSCQVLLLDEITVDLDVLGRADLMDFLKQECRQRGATIIYVSTHTPHPTPPPVNPSPPPGIRLKLHWAALLCCWNTQTVARVACPGVRCCRKRGQAVAAVAAAAARGLAGFLTGGLRLASTSAAYWCYNTLSCLLSQRVPVRLLVPPGRLLCGSMDATHIPTRPPYTRLCIPPVPHSLHATSPLPPHPPFQATHIFDGLESWPSHLMYVAGGRLQVCERAENIPELQQGQLLSLVERWLREEQRQRAALQASDPAEWHRKHVEGGVPQDGEMNLASWNNGWAAGRLTSSIKHASNAVMRM